MLRATWAKSASVALCGVALVWCGYLIISYDQLFKGTSRADCIVEVSVEYPEEWEPEDLERLKVDLADVLWNPSSMGLGFEGQNLGATRFRGGRDEQQLLIYIQFRENCDVRTQLAEDIFALLSDNRDIKVTVSHSRVEPGVDTIRHCSGVWKDCE